MEHDAEYFEKMLREEERTKRRDRDRSDDHKKKKSRERSRDRREPIRRDREPYGDNRDNRENRENRDNRDNRGNREYRERDDQRRDGKDRDRRDNDRDPYYRDRRQIESVRTSDPKKAEEMEHQLQKKIIIDKKTKEVQVMTERFKESQRQLQEAKREDLTVLVYCLPLKAKDTDIWAFFRKEECGKIRDIRIIKDPRSMRSKGVAYVEFYTSESVQKALQTNGRDFQFMGRKSPLKIQHSQAEKNRAAAAARQMRIPKAPQTHEQSNQTMRKQMKLLVGGLTGRLADIQQRQLREPFQSFGNIEKIDINRDPMTGRCRGFAFIQYSKVEDAKNAVRAMSGQMLKGETLSVSIVNVSQQNQQTENMPYGNEFAYASRPKPTGNNLNRAPMATETTNLVLIHDIFTMQGKNPAYFQGLKKQFMDLCVSYGPVEHMFIQRNDQGNIWVKFSDVSSASKAIERLEKIFFDGNRVRCYSVTENTYNSRVTG